MVILHARETKVEVTCDDLVWSVIRTNLQFRPKGYYFSPLYKKGEWDGWVKYYNREEKSFPIGFIDVVKSLLEEDGVDFQVINNNEFRNLDWIDFGESFLAPERDYQREGIEKFIRYRFGVWKVPTRGGKTWMVAESLRLLKNRFFQKNNKEVKSIFIVDTSDLFYQAISDFAKVLDCDESEIGRVKGDVVELKPITVATIQTISSLFKKSIEKKKDQVNKKGEVSQSKANRWREAKNFMSWYRKVEILIVDEIHETAKSKERSKLIKKVKRAYYRLGISATPWDNMIEEWAMLDLFGPLLFEAKEKKLIENNILVKSKVFLFINRKAENFNPEETYLKQYDKCIVKNWDRNLIISGIIQQLKLLDIKTLVLFTKVVQAKIVKIFTGEKLIHGNHSKEERERAKLEFMEGDRTILLASDIYKKGVTLPGAVVMINGSGLKKASNIIQKRGRVMAAAKFKNKAIAIDFIDLFGDENFQNHSLDRIEVYEKLVGKNSIVLIDCDSPNWLGTFKIKLKNWLYD